MPPLRALLVEDNPDDADLVARELKRAGYEVSWERVDTAEAMSAALRRGGWDIVISDYAMPQFNAPMALETLQRSGLDVPFIIVSGTIGEETAVQAMRAGADDYLIKGHLKRLAPAVERELREAADRRKRRAAEEALRQSEAQLRQAQKMEAVGRLAGGVAHDFNNLLTAILGYSELLIRDLKDNPAVQEIGEIKKCGERAANLTRQLLAFSRKQILQPRLMDLNLVVGDMLKMSRRLIGEDVQLVSLTDPSLPKILADPGQMEQVIMNLVVNARDAMPKGGKLSVETASAELAAADVEKYPEVKPGPYVLLTVRDTGVGMSPDVLSKIFEPFFTTKVEGKGTGLGLATVYGIVKQSGGHVVVDSRPGEGTAFRIYLPPAREGDALPVEAPPVPLATLDGSETLLVVEDEETVRDLARRVLTRHGYQVLEAANAGEALLVCEKHPSPIHLMLTDVVMPQMNGGELARRLKPMHPSMKVIFMSGHTEPDILKQVMEQGRPLLLKPFRPDVLARKVRETLTT